MRSARFYFHFLSFVFGVVLPSCGGGSSGASTTASGEIDSVPALEIYQVVPEAAAEGMGVVIKGFDFGTNPAQVRVFFSGIPAKIGNLNSSTILTTVPEDAQTGKIVVQVGADKKAEAPFAVLIEPGITGIEPKKAPAGATVQIQGFNFSPVILQNEVRFGSSKAEILGASKLSLSVRVPDDAQTGPVSVQCPLGSATSTQIFTVDRTPIVKTISPASGSFEENTVLSIEGLNFHPDASANFVKFEGGALAPVLTASKTLLQALVPQGAKTGPISVTVDGLTGTSLQFFVATPKFFDFSPKQASIGALISISGANFEPNAKSNAVSFNGVPGEVISATTSLLVAKVPSGATNGPISVTVETAAGPFLLHSAPEQLSITSERFLYTLNRGDDTIAVYELGGESPAHLVSTRYVGGGTSPAGGSERMVISGDRFVFVFNKTAKKIFPFEIDGETGSLSSLGVSTPVGSNPIAMEMDATGSFLFVLDAPLGTDGSLYGFRIDPGNGALTAIDMDPLQAGINGLSAGANAKGMLIHPKGFVIVRRITEVDTQNVAVFKIEADGFLTTIGAPTPPATPTIMTLSVDGKHLFFVDFWSKALQSLAINDQTGQLSATTLSIGPGISGLTGNSVPAFLAANPFGQFLFLGTTDISQAGNPSQITIFSVDADGDLEFHSNFQPNAVTLVSPGYSASSSGGNPASPTGKLWEVVETVRIGFNQAGQALLLVNPGEIWTMDISTVGPVLTLADRDRTRLNPVDLATIKASPPDDKPAGAGFVYVANTGGSSLGMYGLDSAGAMFKLSPNSISTGASPVQMIAHPSGRFVYVTTKGGSGHLRAYRVEPSGGLTAIANYTLGSEAAGIAIDRRGKILYAGSVDISAAASSKKRTSVHAFSIQTDGSLVSLAGSPVFVDPFTTANPADSSNKILALRVDATGDFLHILWALPASTQLIPIRLAASDGATDGIPAPPASLLSGVSVPSVTSMNGTPDGRLVFLGTFASSASSSTVRAYYLRADGSLVGPMDNDHTNYSVNGQGAVTGATSDSLTVGKGISQIIVSPSGGRIFTVNSAENTVTSAGIQEYSAQSLFAVTPGSTFAVFEGPKQAAVLWEQKLAFFSFDKLGADDVIGRYQIEGAQGLVMAFPPGVGNFLFTVEEAPGPIIAVTPKL